MVELILNGINMQPGERDCVMQDLLATLKDINIKPIKIIGNIIYLSNKYYNYLCNALYCDCTSELDNFSLDVELFLNGLNFLEIA